MEIKIITDKKGLLECREIFRKYYRNVFGTLKLTNRYVVCMDGDKIVSVAGLKDHTYPRTLHYSCIYTYPEYRKQGLTKKLLDFAIKYAQKSKEFDYFRVMKDDNEYPVHVYTKKGLKNECCDERALTLYVGD